MGVRMFATPAGPKPGEEGPWEPAPNWREWPGATYRLEGDAQKLVDPENAVYELAWGLHSLPRIGGHCIAVLCVKGPVVPTVSLLEPDYAVPGRHWPFALAAVRGADILSYGLSIKDVLAHGPGGKCGLADEFRRVVMSSRGGRPRELHPKQIAFVGEQIGGLP